MGSEKQGADLIAALSSNNPAERVEAAQALGRLGNSSARSALLQALHDSDSRVRLAVVVALGRVGARQSSGELASLLNDASALVRGATAMTLSSLGDRGAIGPLEKAVLSERDPVVRQRMASSLQRLREATASAQEGVSGSALDRTEGSLEVALRQLRSRKLGVQVQGARALAELADPRAVQPLIDTLRSPDTTLRVAALMALGAIHEMRARSAAESFLQDPMPLVRVAAAQAVVAIGHRHSASALKDALRLEGQPKVRAYLEAAIRKLPLPVADSRARDALKPGPERPIAEAAEPVVDMLSIKGVEADQQPLVDQWDLLRVTLENTRSRSVWITGLDVIGPIEFKTEANEIELPGKSTVNVQVAAKPRESGRHLPIMVRVSYRDEAGIGNETSALHFIAVGSSHPSGRREGPTVIVSGDYIAPGASKAGGDIFSPAITRGRGSAGNGHPSTYCPSARDDVPPGSQSCPYCGENLRRGAASSESTSAPGSP